MVVEGRQVVLEQVGPEEEPIAGDAAGDIAGDAGSDKPEVRSETGADFGVGTAVEALGGSWPEAAAVSAAAGGEDGAEAVGKLLHFYWGHRTELHSGSDAECPVPHSLRALAGQPGPKN